MELLSEMFRNPIAMWVFIGFMCFMGIIMTWVFLIEIGIIDRIHDKILDIRRNFSNKRKEVNDDIWNFNLPVMFFGGIAILFIIVGESITERIKRWWHRHKWNVIIFLINGAILTPLFLMIGGVIQNMPEFYFPLFIVYLMIMMGVFVSRADNKRSGHQHNYNYDNYDSRYPNHQNSYGYQNPQHSTYVKPKPKPKGLSKEQVSKKKQKIREKLIQEKILQE